MQGLGKLETGGRVLMDAMLDALAELLIDLVVDIFLHGNLGKQLEALLRRLSLKNLDCWRVSRGRLSGKSSESATPLTKFNHFGMRSSQSSGMKTRRTCNLEWVSGSANPGNLDTAGRVLMETEHDALAEQLKDLVVVVILLGNLSRNRETHFTQDNCTRHG